MNKRKLWLFAIQETPIIVLTFMVFMYMVDNWVTVKGIITSVVLSYMILYIYNMYKNFKVID